MDKVAKSAFAQRAPRDGEEASRKFLRARKRDLTPKVAVTSLFFVIIVIWTVG
jgi:hypothetical protein